MPLPIAHGLLGASIVALVKPRDENRNWKPFAWGFALANLPDFDFAFVFLFGWHGFHRGFMHSLFFAFLLGAVIFALLKNETRRLPLALSLALFSHTLLDFATSCQSKGVRLFSPFDEDFYKLGWFGFSELTRGLVISDMLHFAAVEALVFVPFFLLVLFVRKYL
jgi:Predicted membrane-bound metal-dependent hydrolase (DUF457).